MGDLHTHLKLIRVTEGGGAVVGNILIVTKHSKDATTEAFSIRAVPLLSGMQTAMLDKLSINRIEATVDHTKQTITLGPQQGVEFELSLRNRGIGSYIFSELIIALRKVAGTYTFAPYEAGIDSLENHDLVEAFLAHFNIQIQYDLDQKFYMVSFNSPGAMTTYYNKQKIAELELEDYIYNLVNNQRIQRIGKKDEEAPDSPDAAVDKDDEKFFGLTPNMLVRITIGLCVVVVAIIFFLIT